DRPRARVRPLDALPPLALVALAGRAHRAPRGGNHLLLAPDPAARRQDQPFARHVEALLVVLDQAPRVAQPAHQAAELGAGFAQRAVQAGDTALAVVEHLGDQVGA